MFMVFGVSIRSSSDITNTTELEQKEQEGRQTKIENRSGFRLENRKNKKKETSDFRTRAERTRKKIFGIKKLTT